MESLVSIRGQTPETMGSLRDQDLGESSGAPGLLLCDLRA